LEVRGITKRFGGLVAVSDLDMSLDEGEIVGMIGPNGAGKTTAFNLITGFHRPDEGEVRLGGERITGWRPDQICKKGLARTFQVVKPFPGISVLDNVMIGAYNHTNDSQVARVNAEAVLDFVGLSGLAEQMADSLTVGSQRRMELARALATEPKALLLDEPMAGLRPTEMEETIELVRKISEQGIALLVVEHVMKVIMSLAERIVVIHHGVKIAEGAASQVVRNQAVIEAYLGEVECNAAS
jgi:branched-chain amino acid transport system ATP-binding protein